MKGAISTVFNIGIVCGVLAGLCLAQSGPYPRISEEAFRARIPFFAYDASRELEARVVRRWEEPDAVREKFVFRGAQGFLVPGYLELTKGAKKPAALVLLLHGWSGSKEVWYQDTGIRSGGEMRKALLGAGYAILALDSAAHGERASEIGYQSVNAFEGLRNPFTYTEIAVQTVKDYRRALDYVSRRGDLDAGRIGLVGYSMGGMQAFYLLSVEPRLKAAVACVPPLTSAMYGPTSPIDYTLGARGKKLLMLMGRQDKMYDAAQVTASFEAYLAGPETRLVWYDRGHNLTPEYVPDALAWIQRHLPLAETK